MRGFWPVMKAGIYARVSTHDRHTLDMQIAAIRKYVQAREWSIEMEITEIGSGVKERPKRDELINHARRRQVDVIIVWKLDRWGRSVNDLFYSLGISKISNFKKSIIWRGVFPLIEICPTQVLTKSIKNML